MSQEIIEDFRQGLDTRKFKLSAPAGTLRELINLHVTPGGELEKRKALVRSNILAGTFGQVSLTNSTLMVFGSSDLAAGFPKAAFNKTVQYQRLQHPAVLEGTAYDATKHAMTAIVDAKAFGNFAWALAKFSDGNTFGYYNGTVVYDFIDGLVMPNRNTNALLAAMITAAVNRSADYTATLNGTTVSITGTDGAAFTIDTDNTTAAGTTVTAKLNDPQAGVTAVQAVGAFTIVLGATGGFLTGVTVNGVDITSLGTKGDLGGAAVRTVTRARAGSIVTLVYGSAHGLSVGDIVEVSSVGGVSYNGVFAVTSLPDKVTLTYDCGVVATEGTTADTAGRIKRGGLNPLLVNGAANSIYPQTFVPWATSNEATAIVVARIINALTAYSGYSAVAQGGHIVLSATTAGAATNDAKVGVQTGSQSLTAGGFVIDDCSMAFAGSLFAVSQISVDGNNVLTNTHPYPYVKSASYSRAGTLVTFNTGAAFSGGTGNHGLSNGDKVTIAGCTNVLVNGTWTVVGTPSATQFTFNTVGSGAIGLTTESVGTVTVNSTIADLLTSIVFDINNTTSSYGAATDGKKLYLGRANTDSTIANSAVIVTTAGNVEVTTQGTGTLLVKVTRTGLSVQLVNDGFGGTKSAFVGPVRVLVSGGAGPYTFLWSFVNGDAIITALVPNADSTSFGIGAVQGSTHTANSSARQKYSATFSCKVTDANGQVGFGPFVTITAIVPPKLRVSA